MSHEIKEHEECLRERQGSWKRRWVITVKLTAIAPEGKKEKAKTMLNRVVVISSRIANAPSVPLVYLPVQLLE